MPAPPPLLATGTEPLDTTALRAAGFATIVHRQVATSTMEEARALAEDFAATLPAVVVADRQTAGRGRRGAGWWQADGALAASLVVAGDAVSGAPRPLWSLACGVALAEVVRALEPAVAACVKWPNDVVAGDRKLAGILVETAAHGRAVIGIGMNTSGRAADAPPPLRHRVGTLPDLAGRAVERAAVLAALLPRLTRLLADLARDPECLVPRYRRLCGLAGTAVTLHAGAERHSGLCRGISPEGALVIETAEGRREFMSGSLADPAEAWSGSPVG